MSATITVFPRSASSSRAVSSAPPARTGASSVGVASAGVSSASVTRSHLRITRRGRTVLTLAVILAVFAIVTGFLLSGGEAVATGTTGNVRFEHVTVSSGETLWQVAEQVAPAADPRDVIHNIVQLNGLDSTQVMPGQSLAIPTEYTHK